MDKLKNRLRARGASLVGFATLEGLYMHPKNSDALAVPKYPRGVSIALALPREVAAGLAQRPTREYFNAYHELNDKLDALALFCAEYLRELGYAAHAQTVQSVVEFDVYATAMPHKTVAVHAGLGWIGKCALLVTPEYGSAVRLTSVLTNAPLPDAQPLKPRCGGCMACTNACPAHAVKGELWSEERGREHIFDALACRKKARELAADALHEQITLCGRCIGSCPYTRRYTEGYGA